MADLLCDNYSILFVVSCFGITLGVSDKSIEEVCCESGVNVDSFLAVVNTLLRQSDHTYKPSLEGVEVTDVLTYLRKSHTFYLTNRLPKIRVKLVEVLGDDKISMLILKYFDDYVADVKSHIEYEEITLFAYIDAQLSGKGEESKSLSVASHDNVSGALGEFKDVIIKYYKGDTGDVIGVIHDILSCAEDIKRHTYIEEKLLVQLISKLER